MSRERFIERQVEVRDAVARLIEVTSLAVTDIIRDATIQRFEFTFELIWKTLSFYLEHQGLKVAGPRETFKKAFAAGLISSPEEADIWMRMLEDRNLTSHTYNQLLAERIHQHIGEDYAPLISRMSETIQNLSWD